MNTSKLKLKYILVGGSGTGKSTMAKFLEEAFGFKRCITSTTRPPRPGEIDGVDYHFHSVFDPKDMFEMASFGGFQYGITNAELARGDFVILEPQGVRYYRDHYPRSLTVIQLRRENIEVDAMRMARDKAAGFDTVNPDYVVSGETIDTMATNLLAVISQLENEKTSSLETLISQAQRKQTSFLTENPGSRSGENFVR